MDLYQGPLWQETFYGTPLCDFTKRQVFQVISNEMAREFPRVTEFNRALNELGRFGVTVSVDTLDMISVL